MVIVAVKFKEWKSLKSLQTCDKILSSLAISRALYFISNIIQSLFYQFFPWLLRNNIVVPILYIQTMFLYHSSNWIATVLCVFYCVKIVTYNNKLFIFLKTRISVMVPRLILASLLISLISSLLLGWCVFDKEQHKSLIDSPGNMTEYGLDIMPNYNKRFLIFAVGSFPPFIIFCASISLLIHFLLIHTRRMRSNESHKQSPNLTSHIGAIRSMSVFLLLQLMYFVEIDNGQKVHMI
ncbi:taste receptor type 2 member 40-like [Dendropsophus ebraccatus]|uniref:taste receptor type 2 member 40-like n=1 Tax=Dendropsophus ebraccatus TaxID=150705 RepID=UPI003831FC07